LKKAIRKDANVMAQIFISASPEWFADDSLQDSLQGDVSRKGYLKDDAPGNNNPRNNDSVREIPKTRQRQYFEDAYV